MILSSSICSTKHRTHGHLRALLADENFCSPASSVNHITHERRVPVASSLKTELSIYSPWPVKSPNTTALTTYTHLIVHSINIHTHAHTADMDDCARHLPTRISVRRLRPSITSRTNAGSLLLCSQDVRDNESCPLVNQHPMER